MCLPGPMTGLAPMLSAFEQCGVRSAGEVFLPNFLVTGLADVGLGVLSRCRTRQCSRGLRRSAACLTSSRCAHSVRMQRARAPPNGACRLGSNHRHSFEKAFGERDDRLRARRISRSTLGYPEFPVESNAQCQAFYTCCALPKIIFEANFAFNCLPEITFPDCL